MSRERDALVTLIEAIRYVFPDPAGTFSAHAVRIAEEALRPCEHVFDWPAERLCTKGCGATMQDAQEQTDEERREKDRAPLWEIARGVHRMASVLEQRLPVSPLHGQTLIRQVGWQEIGSPVWLVHQRMEAFLRGKEAGQQEPR